MFHRPSHCPSSKSQGRAARLWAIVGLHRAEQAIAGHVVRLARGAPPWPDIDTDKAITWLEQQTGLNFAASQQQAIHLALSSKVLVVMIKAAEFLEETVLETLAYYAFPEQHRHRIRTDSRTFDLAVLAERCTAHMEVAVAGLANAAIHANTCDPPGVLFGAQAIFGSSADDCQESGKHGATPSPTTSEAFPTRIFGVWGELGIFSSAYTLFACRDVHDLEA